MPCAKHCACLHLPIETSKLMGLSPIFRSIMEASKNAPKSKNSSYFSGIIYRNKKNFRQVWLYFFFFFLLPGSWISEVNWSRVICRHLSFSVNLKGHIIFPLIRKAGTRTYKLQIQIQPSIQNDVISTFWVSALQLKSFFLFKDKDWHVYLSTLLWVKHRFGITFRWATI